MCRKHAILSASGAHRWLNCPPSARLEEPMPDTSSVYAQEGTLAHDLAELQLRTALRETYGLPELTKHKITLQKIVEHELFSVEMPDYVQKYVDYALEQYHEALGRSEDAVIFLEQRLDFSQWVPEGFGTGDCTIISDRLMEVIDFKYGKGVEVEAEENEQMKLYALGALDTYGYIYDIDTIRMTVHQPRINNISSWEVSVDELLDWALDVLKPTAKLAWEGKGEAKAGDWCRFCKVKARCKTRAQAMQAVPSDFDYKSPDLLNIEEVAEILTATDEIQRWAKDVQDFALEQARDHKVRFPGFKLVEGRSNRRYADSEAVEKKLRAARYRVKDIFKPQELLGITAMTKLLGAKKFKEMLEDTKLVVKPQGRPTLVPESDKRPEINSAAADFDL